MKMIVSVNFLITGKVQGVFFRKYTLEAATKFGLTGFVQNNADGTVSGFVEGEEYKVDQMIEWLKHTGSPMSVIEKSDFTEKTSAQAARFKNFTIRR